jgi:hypothetical protein
MAGVRAISKEKMVKFILLFEIHSFSPCLGKKKIIIGPLDHLLGHFVTALAGLRTGVLCDCTSLPEEVPWIFAMM